MVEWVGPRPPLAALGGDGGPGGSVVTIPAGGGPVREAQPRLPDRGAPRPYRAAKNISEAANILA
ncbi:MAG: hypothetical protein QOF44_3304 [Streptomyces sp.]|nr:hypothetical protein [Streptomyces sp.]